MKSLLEIMSRLRDPEAGCPWDLEQDFSSISPHTIEEAYEVDEAISSGDLESLRDELGDLLFQVVFQSRIAEEIGAFDFEAVTEAITEKLIRRHPHIFGDAETPPSNSDQSRSWEAIKAEERAAAALSLGRVADPFEGIPRNLPALARSAKLAGRLERIESENASSTANSGFRSLPASPPTTSQILSRLDAANRSAHEATAREPVTARDRSSTLRLVGEGLRAWVLLARARGVDPEQALRLVDDETIASIRAEKTETGPNAPTGDRHHAGHEIDR